MPKEKSLTDLSAEFWNWVSKEQRKLPKVKKSRLGIEAWIRPIKSDAMAVHPDQVPEARELAKKKGVPTDFLPDGRPLFTSSRHFREYARKHGFRHKGYC